MHCTRPTRRRQQLSVDCSAHHPVPGSDGLLLPGERILTDAVPVHGWRFEQAEVIYERKTLMLGGPLLFVLTGIASALRNRSARKTAEAQAAPQWRPLGPLTVLATTDRLLVRYQDAWWSVWYSAITHTTCDGQQLQLQFLDAAPYLMAGDVLRLAETIETERTVDA